MAKGTAAKTATATATVGAKKKRGLSAETRLKLALNDVLDVVKEGKASDEAPEVVHAQNLLKTLGFETRKSSASRLLELQEELKSLDITDADSQARINKISKEIGKLRRG